METQIQKCKGLSQEEGAIKQEGKIDNDEVLEMVTEKQTAVTTN